MNGLETIQVTELLDSFNELQKIYGDENLDAICGCGQICKPKVCLVFMNPTGRNIASNKNWTGIKAPWLGTKNVWNMFYGLGFIDRELYDEIKQRKPDDWDIEFAETVYNKISENFIYITNLSKATQVDARPLPNSVFREYIDLFKKEIDIIKPEIIITFGNQVSSIILGKNINVSKYRKKHELLSINDVTYKVFPVYYPVGQGTRNVGIAREDIDWVLNREGQG